MEASDLILSHFLAAILSASMTTWYFLNASYDSCGYSLEDYKRKYHKMSEECDELERHYDKILQRHHEKIGLLKDKLGETLGVLEE